MDLQGGTMTPGTVVILWDGNQRWNQRWFSKALG